MLRFRASVSVILAVSCVLPNLALAQVATTGTGMTSERVAEAKMNPLLDPTTECGKTFSEMTNVLASEIGQALQQDPKEYENSLNQFLLKSKPRLEGLKATYEKQATALRASYAKKIAAKHTSSEQVALQKERDAKLLATEKAYAAAVQKMMLTVSRTSEAQADRIAQAKELKKLATEEAEALKATPPRDRVTRAHIRSEYLGAVKAIQTRYREQTTLTDLAEAQLPYVSKLSAYYCGSGLVVMKQETELIKTLVAKLAAHQNGLVDPTIKNTPLKLFEWDATWAKMLLPYEVKMREFSSAVIAGLKAQK